MFKSFANGIGDLAEDAIEGVSSLWSSETEPSVPTSATDSSTLLYAMASELWPGAGITGNEEQFQALPIDIEVLDRFLIANGAPTREDENGNIVIDDNGDWSNLDRGAARTLSAVMDSRGGDSTRHFDSNFNHTPVHGIATGPYGELLNTLAHHEAGGNYDIVYNGAQAHFNRHFGGEGVTQQTVGDILQWQRDVINQTDSPSSAVGAFQFVGPTLRGLVRNLDIDLNARFTPELQQRLAMELLREAGVPRHLESGNIAAAENATARIWASIYRADGSGQYDGYVGNRAYGDAGDVLARTAQNLHTPEFTA